MSHLICTAILFHNSVHCMQVLFASCLKKQVISYNRVYNYTRKSSNYTDSSNLLFILTVTTCRILTQSFKLKINSCTICLWRFEYRISLKGQCYHPLIDIISSLHTSSSSCTASWVSLKNDFFRGLVFSQLTWATTKQSTGICSNASKWHFWWLPV